MNSAVKTVQINHAAKQAISAPAPQAAEQAISTPAPQAAKQAAYTKIDQPAQEQPAQSSGAPVT